MADITRVNMHRVDLNLLTVLHAILAEGSVTRAARRLSMTQPAVSNALRRARTLLRDDLFTKGPGGLRPTERALAIWPELDSALTRLAELTQAPNFSPETTSLTFRIAITDALVGALVPRLTERFLCLAPRAHLHFSLHTNTGSLSNLDQGHLDCAIGMFPNPPSSLLMRRLITDAYVCVMRENHPLSEALTLDAFTSARHILVKQASQSRGFVDIWLELNGRKRAITTIVNRFEDALKLAGRTDLLSCVPHRFALAADHPGVVLRPLPFPAEPLIYKLMWHERTDKSAPQIWFRQLVGEIVAEAFP